jgi:hypothetical protein
LKQVVECHGIGAKVIVQEFRDLHNRHISAMNLDSQIDLAEECLASEYIEEKDIGAFFPSSQLKRDRHQDLKQEFQTIGRFSVSEV